MQYEITAPDGKKYMINAPDGATEAEILAYAQGQFSPQEEPPPPAAVAPQEDYMTRENLMSTQPVPQARILEDALIGAGRFLSEAGQGIKQKALMAGEELGLVDEGRAQEYTEQVIKPDTRRWKQGTEGVGAEDVGYYGAMMAPSMAVGPMGVAGTTAMGALEAGILPTEEADWAEAMKQAGVGAAFAGTLRSAPEGIAAFRQWRKNKQLGKVDEDIVALAEQYGVKVPRSVNRPSVVGKASEEAARLPVIGKPFAERSRQSVRDTLDEMTARTTGNQNTQEAFVAGREALEEADSQAWKATNRLVGDAPIDRQRLNNDISEIMAGMGDDTIAQSQREAIRELWRPVKSRPQFKGKTMEEYEAFQRKWDAQDQIRGFAGDTLEDLHRFRAKFGAAQKANWNEKGWNTAYLDEIYGRLSDEMYDAANRSYGKAGADLVQKSVDDTRQMHRTIDSARVMKAAASDKIDSQSTFVRSALSSDRDKIQAMKTVLGEKGAPAVQREIIEDIARTFDIYGGNSAMKRTKKLDESIRTFFGEDQAAAIRGLGKFMDNIPPEKQSAIRTLLSGIGVGAGVGFTNPAGIAAASAIAWRWTRRQDVNAMLQKLETTAVDSPMYKALSNELAESLAVVAGVEQSRPPMEVQIRDGVPQ